MPSSSVWSDREACVIEYLTLLESASHKSWFEFDPFASLPTALLLCHPGWLSDPSSQAAGLGLGAFRGASRGLRCEAFSLWGYECPLTEEGIESDHLFPRSLGGPWVGSNQVWLCQVHNAWKSSDLMHFPWERGRPAWLDPHLQRMQGVVLRDDPIQR